MTQHSDRRPETNPGTLERDIGRTRAEIGLTVAALKRKFTARHLLKEGLDMAIESFNGSQAIHRGLDAVRANPVPVALIGIGAAWLLAANTGLVDRLAQDERVDTAKRRASELASEIGTRAGELAEGTVQSARETAEAAVNGAGAALNGAVSSVGERAEAMADRLVGAVERNPLVIGAIGVMAGALIASLLPTGHGEGASEAVKSTVEKAEDAVKDGDIAIPHA
jgi:ElaB/YqjD/DUF883 family membrane-anchored ribosome-binding protein